MRSGRYSQVRIHEDKCQHLPTSWFTGILQTHGLRASLEDVRINHEPALFDPNLSNDLDCARHLILETEEFFHM